MVFTQVLFAWIELKFVGFYNDTGVMLTPRVLITMLSKGQDKVSSVAGSELATFKNKIFCTFVKK